MTRRQSSEQSPLAELAALIQLGNAAQAPQLEQQRMQQTAQDRSMAAALNVLGLQQQSEQAAAIEAFRQAQLKENSRQFDTGVRQQDAQQQAVGQRFAQDVGLREKEITQRGEDLGFRRDVAAGDVADRAAARALQEKELLQREKLGATGNMADIVRVLLADPNTSLQLRGSLAGSIDPRLAATFAGEQTRLDEEALAKFGPQVDVLDDPKLREQLISTAPVSIAGQLRSRAQAKPQPQQKYPSDRFWYGGPNVPLF